MDSVKIHIGRAGYDSRVLIDGKEMKTVTKIEISPIEPGTITTATITFAEVEVDIEPGVVEFKKA